MPTLSHEASHCFRSLPLSPREREGERGEQEATNSLSRGVRDLEFPLTPHPRTFRNPVITSPPVSSEGQEGGWEGSGSSSRRISRRRLPSFVTANSHGRTNALPPDAAPILGPFPASGFRRFALRAGPAPCWAHRRAARPDAAFDRSPGPVLALRSRGARLLLRLLQELRAPRA